MRKDKAPCPWNKGISKKKNTKKKFPPQRKEVLNSYNIGNSWFDYEEESWNLESCGESASGRKIVIPEEYRNYNYQESYSGYDEYKNDSVNVVK